MLVNITYGHNHVSTGNKPYKVKIPIYNTSKDKVSVVLSSAHWSSSQDVSWCGSVGKKVTQRIYWQKQKETQTAVYKEYPNGWIPMGKGMWSGGGGGADTKQRLTWVHEPPVCSPLLAAAADHEKLCQSQSFQIHCHGSIHPCICCETPAECRLETCLHRTAEVSSGRPPEQRHQYCIRNHPLTNHCLQSLSIYNIHARRLTENKVAEKLLWVYFFGLHSCWYGLWSFFLCLGMNPLLHKHKYSGVAHTF